MNIIRRLFQKKSFLYGKDSLVDEIRKFIAGDPSLWPYDWDDFTLNPMDDPYEAMVQSLIGYIESYFASRRGISEWCHPLGIKALARLADAIETETLPYPLTDQEKYELDHGDIPARYRNIFFGDCDPGVSMPIHNNEK